jgi:hypothetical protein
VETLRKSALKVRLRYSRSIKPGCLHPRAMPGISTGILIALSLHERPVRSRHSPSAPIKKRLPRTATNVVSVSTPGVPS